MTAEDPSDRPAAPLRRGRPGIRWPVTGLALVVIVALGAIGALALTGKTLRLPAWAVAEVEMRLDEAFRGASPLGVSVGGIAVAVDPGWLPRLQLTDLRVARPDGATLLTLPEARIMLDPAALLRGEVRPRAVTVVGAGVTLRRGRDGRLDLDLGAGGAAVGVARFADLLDAVDAAFAAPGLAALATIEGEALSLTLVDDRAGRTWRVGDGRLRVENRAEAVALEFGMTLAGGRGAPAQATLSFVTDKAGPAARIAATVDRVAAADLAAQAAPLAFLAVLDAPISGALTASVDAAGIVGGLEGRLDIAAGALRPVPDVRPVPFDHAGLYLRYDAAAERIELTELTVEARALRLAASGQVLLPGVREGLPRQFVAQIAFDRVAVDPEGLFEEPVRFSGGALDLRLRLDPFAIDIGQVSLTEEGRRLVASGQATADAEGWRLALDLSLDAIRHDRMLALWPVALVPRTRAWLVDNVQEGLLSDVQAALRLAPGRQPRLSLSYEFADADVRFLRTLPPIRRGSGYATVEGSTYTMVLDAGEVTPPEGGRIDMTGSVFSVLDITQRPPQAEIRLKTDSTLTAALSLLDQPPFRFLAKAGRPVALGEGRARLDALLRLPLVRRVELADVRYEVAGTITDVASMVLVPGRRLAADRLSLAADPSGLRIEGPGRIGTVPFEAVYTLGFGPGAAGRSRIEGTVELSPATVEEFALGLPRGAVGGAATGRFGIDLVRGETPRLTLGSDLRGAMLSLPQLGWSKPRAEAAALTVEATLGRPARVDRLTLDAPGLDARGTVALNADGTLEAARFSRVVRADWFDGAVTLTGRGAGRPPAIAVEGGTLDTRRMTFGGPGGPGSGGPSPPLAARLDRVTVSEGIALTGFQGDFSLVGGFNGTFTARINDQAPIRGTLGPAANGTAIRVQANDAGAAMAAAGIFANARGGPLDLQLIPSGPAGHYSGTAVADGLRVTGAPVLAELLNAISVIGLLEQLNGAGLPFVEARADFRMTPQAVEVTRASAVGASMGVSLAGIYETATGRLDMQGVISPLYLVNSVGSLVSRRGEGLFGFNYSLRGTADAPQVRVNPLSILTPGAFRELFRRPAPVLPPTPAPETQ